MSLHNVLKTINIRFKPLCNTAECKQARPTDVYISFPVNFYISGKNFGFCNALEQRLTCSVKNYSDIMINIHEKIMSLQWSEDI